MPSHLRANDNFSGSVATQSVHAELPIDIDAEIEPLIAESLDAVDGQSSLLIGMVRYHLGYVNSDLSPASDAVRLQSRGKRLRPALALLTCAALGGESGRAAPVAVAIELAHNFTLIHDDIQDRSATRRHRPTVWALWGDAQAINAGDALFAASHLAILGLAKRGVPAPTVLDLVDAFNRMTIAIVEGQVLDLGFEGRRDVTSDDYIRMIAGKTSAIVRFAAQSGSILAGASPAIATDLAAFGLALGLGYQVRDDMLGIWGGADVTGKVAADDIRRRKQSLPIVLLRERATPAEIDRLDALYTFDPIDDAGVATVLAMLDRHAIADIMAARVESLHQDALAALRRALGEPVNAPAHALYALTEQLASRAY